MRDELGIHGGMLIGNPVPEEKEIEREEMEIYINRALENAEADGIAGKAVTPYLLSSIFDITEGRSLDTKYRAGGKNNARLAARIALALND